MERAAEAGLRSLFVGFETLSTAGLAAQGKRHNVGRDYAAAVRRLHDLGVMVNASFVFGMDDDGRTSSTARSSGRSRRASRRRRSTSSRPYPGTALLPAPRARGAHHARPTGTATTPATPCSARLRMTAEELEAGYARARKRSTAGGASSTRRLAHETLGARARHLAYAGGWKKAEPVWDLLIRLRSGRLVHAAARGRARRGAAGAPGAQDGAAAVPGETASFRLR